MGQPSRGPSATLDVKQSWGSPLYRIGDPELAEAWDNELAATLDDRVYSHEIRRLGRT
jgi:hypothetical protein